MRTVHQRRYTVLFLCLWGGNQSREEQEGTNQSRPNQTIRDPKEPRGIMCLQCSHRHKHTNGVNKRPKQTQRDKRRP